MTTMFSALLFLVATAAAPSRLPNACQLLSAREIAHVQGEAFRSAKLTETEADGLRVSQCFYALPSFTNSVSVDLMHGKTKTFWKEHFSNARAERDADDDHGRDAAMKTAPPTREAEEEHQSAVRKVAGVGDTAVWSGNRMSGALYVLKGDSIVRISVGGKGSEDEKIERSRKLAATALRKL
jgi:hypothetical protein